jgi:adenylate cyclase
VRYILEGSVRKAGDRIRITAQLIDATTDHHLWSERYDRSLKDIFALQDEIVQKIVTTLKLQLTIWEQGILVRKTTDNLEAYDFCLRGLESLLRLTKETYPQAQRLFERALELDPQYALAHAGLGIVHYLEWMWQWTPDPEALDRAFELTQRAVTLDDSLPRAHIALATVLLLKKQHEQAVTEAERVIALAPNSAEGYAALGFVLAYAGRPQEGIEALEKAIRLNPHYPVLYLSYLGHAYHLAGRDEEAIIVWRRALTRNPSFPPAHVFLAATYSDLGRDEEAQAEAATILRLIPSFSLEMWGQRLPYKDPAVLERVLAALRKAGLK